MPSRTAAAPRTFPTRFLFPRLFSAAEIQRIFFLVILLDAYRFHHLIDTLAGEPSELLEFTHVVINVAADRISKSLLDQTLNGRDHLRNIAGGARLNIRRRDT